MTAQPAPKRSMKIQSDVPLALPSPEAEQRLALRRVDWRRIRRLVEEMANPSPAAAVWPSTFLGVAVTAGLSLIPLAQSTRQLETWVIPTFIVVTIAALALAGYAQWAWHLLSKQRENDVAFICADMDEIASAYEAEAEREAVRAEPGIPGAGARGGARTEEVRRLVAERPLTVKEISEGLGIPIALAAGIVSGLATVGAIERHEQLVGPPRWGLMQSEQEPGKLSDQPRKA